MQRIEREFAGRKLVIETGRMAKQAAGSALVQFGDTMVLAAVTVSDKESPLDFFPLLVEYRDKAYAAGKIPGGFIKREGRPHDSEILKARIIDRSIRPLFPEGFKNEVQVFIYVVSADQENDADVLALLAASYAINSSKIPFMGPIAAVRVGRVQENWILNPTFQQLPYSDMDIVVAGSQDSIMMVEGGAIEVSEEDTLQALTSERDARAGPTGENGVVQGADSRQHRCSREGSRRRQDRRGDQSEGEAHAYSGSRGSEIRSARAAAH
jgi:polyribonucleotide nucleotidyltransferase